MSNFFTYFARGNTPLSITMSGISTLAATFMTPLNIGFWASMNPETQALMREINLSLLDMAILVSSLLVGAVFFVLTADLAALAMLPIPLILVGAFSFSPGLVILSTLRVILSAAYILWMVQRVMYGEVTNPKNATLPDLNPREWATLLPLVFLAIFMGVLSSWFTPSIERPVLKIIQDARAKVTMHKARTGALPRLEIPPPPQGGN